MRLLVLSDSHGSNRGIRQAIEQQPQVENIIHLGDGERDMDPVTLYQKHAFQVYGNCDFSGDSPCVRIETFEGVKLFMCHGHTYNVKYGLQELKAAARANGCTVALFGHTHTPVTLYEDGLYLVNPGSASVGSRRSYATLDITPQGIFANIVYL